MTSTRHPSRPWTNRRWSLILQDLLLALVRGLPAAAVTLFRDHWLS